MHILELEITSKCNLNCKHCYNRGEGNKELSLENLIKYYEFSKENEVKTMVISGGEAVLHSKFKEFCDYIRKDKNRKFELVLQTNGLAKELLSLNELKLFNHVHISFDVVNSLREDSYKNIYFAKELLENGINAYLFTTLHKDNYLLLDEILEIVSKENIPIGFNTCLPINNKKSLIGISHKDFFLLEKKLSELSLKGKILRYSSPLISVFDPGKSSEIYEANKGGCVAGIASVVVSFNGNVYACPFLRISAGNIFEKSLEGIWENSSLFAKLRNRSAYNEECANCKFLEYCGGCRNRAYQSSNNIQEKDPNCYLEFLK